MHIPNSSYLKSFKREEDCVQDFNVDSSNFTAQSKMKLNIGGMSMKKKANNGT